MIAVSEDESDVPEKRIKGEFPVNPIDQEKGGGNWGDKRGVSSSMGA